MAWLENERMGSKTWWGTSKSISLTFSVFDNLLKVDIGAQNQTLKLETIMVVFEIGLCGIPRMKLSWAMETKPRLNPLGVAPP